MKTASLSLVAFAACLVAATASPAASLISDNFNALTTSTNDSPVGSDDLNTSGWYFWSPFSAGTRWYVSSPGDAASGPDYLSGATMFNRTGPNAGTNAFRSFTPTTLTNVGDSLTLSLDIRSLAPSGVNTGIIAITLGNIGAPITANSFVDGSTNPLNGKYIVSYNQNLLTSQAQRTYNYGTFGSGTSATSAGTWAALADGVDHRFILTVTRTATGLSLTSSITETNGSTTTLNTVSFAGSNFTFDTLRLSVAGTTESPYGQFTYFDNINLTSTSSIPEPGSYALLAGAAAAGVLLFRRRRV